VGECFGVDADAAVRGGYSAPGPTRTGTPRGSTGPPTRPGKPCDCCD
jgi:hypothetical protein